MTVRLCSVRSGMIYSGSYPKNQSLRFYNLLLLSSMTVMMALVRLNCISKGGSGIRIGWGLFWIRPAQKVSDPTLHTVSRSCATEAGLMPKPQVALNYGKRCKRGKPTTVVNFIMPRKSCAKDWFKRTVPFGLQACISCNKHPERRKWLDHSCVNEG
jgi:hypothetical protein